MAEIDLTQNRKTELLVIQPTTFCNLDCSYCYLPHRNSKNLMQLATVSKTIERLKEGELIGNSLSIVWHAGEPLVVSPKWYEEAFKRIEEQLPNTMVEHNFQTNGVLIDATWIEFFKRNNIRLGISLDGPEFLHDASRLTRSGRGTHAAVMRGVRLLRDQQIPFHVIAVLTYNHLPCADELFDFFMENDILNIGFNIEEIDGVNKKSSFNQSSTPELFTEFWTRILDRYRLVNGKMRIREIERVVELLRNLRNTNYNSQAEAFSIVSVDYKGGVSTFSPELLGTEHASFGSFEFGNIYENSFTDIRSSGKFRVVMDEIQIGVGNCKKECPFFSFCLGGAPANKLAETGGFDTTSTMFCFYSIMLITELTLKYLERDLKTTVLDV